MKLRSLLFFSVILLTGIHLLGGCGQKKETKQPVTEIPAVSGELPILEQNIAYLLNTEAPPAEPDYSFTPVSNDLEPVPADAVPTPSLD